MKKSHIIWDWNGTIVDDVDLCVQIIGEIAAKHGLERVTKDQYLRKFRFPVNEYYRDIGFTEDLVEHSKISRMFMSAYESNVKHLKLFPGMPELLIDLHNFGIKQSILSAAHEKDLVLLLEHFQLSPYFTFVCGQDNREAHGKIARGRDLIRLIREPADKILLVGDTLHDAEVAEHLGIDALILSGGHQHPETLGLRAHLFHHRYSEI